MAKKKKTNVNDVAAYILRAKGQMTTMKLQKLVYYCQAWALVWDEEPLFRADIEAWANGPVVRELYDQHRGKFQVRTWRSGDPDKLNRTQRETVDAVLEHYGDKSSQWLSDLTHLEQPWREARRGMPADSRGSKVISHASMAEYYGSLPA